MSFSGTQSNLSCLLCFADNSNSMQSIPLENNQMSCNVSQHTQSAVTYVSHATCHTRHHTNVVPSIHTHTPYSILTSASFDSYNNNEFLFYALIHSQSVREARSQCIRHKTTLFLFYIYIQVFQLNFVSLQETSKLL